MSTDQSDLGEFDGSSPRHPKNSGKGTPKSEQTGRPKCGEERTDGKPCENPVLPGGYERCWRHLEEESSNEQDVSYLLSATKASENDVGGTEETRCPNGHPIPAMYRPMCPECGHRRED